MKNIIQIAIKKALQSDCRYNVSAIGLSKKGDVIGTAVNKHHISEPGRSLHAETELIKKYGRKIKNIIICRTNRSGTILPIHPCNNCQKMADRYGIIIKSIK